MKSYLPGQQSSSSENKQMTKALVEAGGIFFFFLPSHVTALLVQEFYQLTSSFWNFLHRCDLKIINQVDPEFVMDGFFKIVFITVGIYHTMALFLHI